MLQAALSVLVSLLLYLPLNAWKLSKALWGRVWGRPNVSLSVGETLWYRSGKKDDAEDVQCILVQVWLGNSSQVGGSASVARLEIERFSTYFPAGVEEIDGGAYLTGPAGGTEHVASFRPWLPPVVNLGPWQSHVGWVAFVTREPWVKGMTFAQAKSAKGKVVALVPGKGEVSAPVAPYTGP